MRPRKCPEAKIGGLVRVLTLGRLQVAADLGADPETGHPVILLWHDLHGDYVQRASVVAPGDVHPLGGPTEESRRAEAALPALRRREPPRVTRATRSRKVRAPDAPHPRAKLSAEDVREIRSLAAEGESLTAIGRRYSIGRTTVRQIVLREIWRHV